MPQSLTMIQTKQLTPMPSVLLITGLSFVYLTSSDITMLMNYVGFATWLAVGVAVVCIPYLRWKHPEWERPIKVHLAFPVIYVTLTAFITILPMISNPLETLIGLAMILSAFPVYFMFIWPKKSPQGWSRFRWQVYFFLQKLLVVVPEAKDD